MMFVSIVFRSPLDVDKVIIEDELEEEFASDGEVTGAGIGQTLSHLDLEVNDGLAEADVVTRVRKTLAFVGLGIGAEIVVEGKTHIYSPEDGE